MSKESYSELWAMEPTHLESLLMNESTRNEILSATNAVALQAPGTSHVGEKYGSVAILHIRGGIYRYNQIALRNEIEAALADDSISSILLNINSPGGLVAGTKELADFIVEARKIKPMASYVDGLCASAAMWLASATGTIYAPQTASLGSVGVISILPNYSKMNEQWGVSYTYLTAGKWKSAGNSDFAPTDEERTYLQNRIDSLHGIFKADIGKNLSLKSDESLWGDAQVFLAQEAKDLGIVKAIVRDISEACEKFQTYKEKIMDRKTLAEQHPELLQAILEEGKQSAKSESDEKASADTQSVMTFLSAILPKAEYENVAKVMASCDSAGISLDQASKLVPLLAMQAQDEAVATEMNTAEASAEEKSRQDILSSLQKVSAQPVNADSTDAKNIQPKSALIANAQSRETY